MLAEMESPRKVRMEIVARKFFKCKPKLNTILFNTYQGMVEFPDDCDGHPYDILGVQRDQAGAVKEVLWKEMSYWIRQEVADATCGSRLGEDDVQAWLDKYGEDARAYLNKFGAA